MPYDQMQTAGTKVCRSSWLIALLYYEEVELSPVCHCFLFWKKRAV